jgi:hypothetical protein
MLAKEALACHTTKQKGTPTYNADVSTLYFPVVLKKLQDFFNRKF